MKFSTLLWMLVIVVASFMLYKVKYQVQALKDEVAELSRELEHEREALHVVNAEWAYLNRPARLQRLASKYLAATDLTVSQIAEVEEIPFPRQSMAKIGADAGKEGEIKTVALMVRKGGAPR
ncbi:MAG: hypothetical protein K2Q01_11590 [Rickettsiales bacterium]|nr:hypothetical protein [Rickettsiales bacterium]